MARAKKTTGFFTRLDVKNIGKRTAPKGRGLPLDVLHEKECKVCTMNHVEARNPKMLPTGKSHPDVYILGEAPGKLEDIKARQFIGKSGQLLRKYLPKGYKIRFNNTARCRPPDNRTPTELEVECCRPSIEKDIEQSKPKIVLGFGRVPLRWALSMPGKMSQMEKWRGRRIPVQIRSHACWFYPVTHPSYILRMQIPEQERTFESDIKRAFNDLSQLPAPEIEDLHNLDDGITCIERVNDKSIDRIEEQMARLMKKKMLAVDIETSGLRPGQSNAMILSIAIGTGKEVLAFPLDHPEANWKRDERRRLIRMLKNFILSPIPKIVHSLRFELEWFIHLFGNEVARGTTWHCTMAQAYVLDERSKTHSLDFCTLNILGFRVKKQSGVDLKSLARESLLHVLKYNGRDTKYEFRLFYRQRQLLKQCGLPPHVYRDQIERVPTVVLAQRAGMDVNQTTVKKFQARYEKKVLKIDKKITRNRYVREYVSRFGTFNPASPKHVLNLMRNIIGIVTTTTNEAFLSEVKDKGFKVAGLILKRRSIVKLKSTYIDPLDKDSPNSVVYVDGKIHTNFNTTFTKTRRLSSDDPNVQNYPIRKDKFIREMIVAPPGCRILSSDYGQIEYRVLGMASHDRAIIKAIGDGYDIHMAWAERMSSGWPKLLEPHDGDIKGLRALIKNQLVFPAFYGASYKSIALALGISEDEFKMVFYKEFWPEYTGVRKWQGKIVKDFYKNDYVETLTNFRRHAPLGYNEVINSPIQGTASDIVVDAMNRISIEAEKEKDPYLQPRWNIHDDLTFIIPNRDRDGYMQRIARMMVDVPFDFVNVPIAIDMKLGKNWYDMEEAGDFDSTGKGFS